MSLEGWSEDAIKAYAELAHNLETHPETRLETMRLAKKLNPNRSFPELEALEREQKLRQEFNEQREKDRKEAEERELRQRRENMIVELISTGQVASRAEFEEIEKFGIENKIGDYAKAKQFYDLSRTPSEPSGAVIPDFGPPTKPTMEGIDKLGGNHHQWAMQEANRAIQDIKSGKVKLPNS